MTPTSLSSKSKSTADSQRLHSDRPNQVSLCRLNGKLWITAFFAKSDKSATSKRQPDVFTCPEGRLCEAESKADPYGVNN